MTGQFPTRSSLAPLTAALTEGIPAGYLVKELAHRQYAAYCGAVHIGTYPVPSFAAIACHAHHED